MNQTKELRYALEAAGENKKELEKVLEYYKNDSQKLEAARFLIRNMPGHVGYDSLYIKQFQPIYDKYEAISVSHDWERSGAWYNEIDSLWKKEKEINNPHSRPYHQDVKTIKADWLIRQIDLAFKAWQENVYTKECSFESFCQYILPYRIIDGIVPDEARPVFYERHAGFFTDADRDFQEVSDSLHYLYSDLKHNNFAALTLPVVDARTAEHIKRLTCDHMAWYNVLMMTSLGMATTIDFVPAWGNRNSGHRWNALVIDNETFPFEPFWDDDRWKYKTIYNNTTVDVVHGKFRLPKVFRQTYEYHLDGPIGDPTVSKEDIPSLFLTPFIKDVSSQYFETTDVTLQLKDKNAESSYCYLCVYETKRWSPVQWGKSGKNNQVTFKDMGRDIVYFPMYYIKGRYVPAADPFLLDSEGNIHDLKPDETEQSITIQTPTSYFFPEEIEESKQLIRGAELVAYYPEQPDRNFSLFSFAEPMDLFYNKVDLSTEEEVQYIKLIAPSDTFGLCEIHFYEATDAGMEKIRNVKVSGSLLSCDPKNRQLNMLTDGLSATGFKGIFSKEKELLFDLRRLARIVRIEFVPYTDSYVEDTHEYNLFYWENDQWALLETLPGDDKPITFQDVPVGGLYRLQKSPNYATERIFTYEDGLIRWY